MRVGRLVIVDFHTHLLPASFNERRAEIAARDNTFGTLFGGGGSMATAEDLIAAMDESGVDFSVVLGFGWCDRDVAREANDCLLDAAARYPERIAAFCSVHPGWGDDALREMERCVDAGAVGIGELHPTSQGIDLASDDSVRAAGPVRGGARTVHRRPRVGAGRPRLPRQGSRRRRSGCSRSAQRFPDVRWVFAHWGGGLPFYALMPEVKRGARERVLRQRGVAVPLRRGGVRCCDTGRRRRARPVRLGLSAAAGLARGGSGAQHARCRDNTGGARRKRRAAAGACG